MKEPDKVEKFLYRLGVSRIELPRRPRPYTAVTPELFKRGRYLTASAKWLYVVLKGFANNKSGEIFPSYQAIMKQGGLTKNAVAKGLAELRQFGWVSWEKTKGKGNKYKLYYPDIKSRDKAEDEADNQTFPTKEMAEAWAKSRRPQEKTK